MAEYGDYQYGYEYQQIPIGSLRSICFGVGLFIAITLGVVSITLLYTDSRFTNNSSSLIPSPVKYFAGCSQNCARCVKNTVYSDKKVKQNDIVQCRKMCICCRQYQTCLDNGGSFDDCQAAFRACRFSEPGILPGTTTYSPICDLASKGFNSGIFFALQGCIDMGVNVTLPPIGACCFDITCSDNKTDFDCPPPRTYKGDGTLCVNVTCV